MVEIIDYSRTRLPRLEYLLYHIDIHVTLSKLLILSMPQYSHLQNGDKNGFLTDLLLGLCDMMYKNTKYSVECLVSTSSTETYLG